MFKIINYSIIFLFFILVFDVFAQNQIDSTAHPSKSISDKPTYQLKLNPLLNSNKLFLGQKDFVIENPQLNLNEKILLENNTEKSLQDLKFQLKNYMSRRKNLLPNNDLGDFAVYLGYANTLAAIILAIAHISKYGFK